MEYTAIDLTQGAAFALAAGFVFLFLVVCVLVVWLLD